MIEWMPVAQAAIVMWIPVIGIPLVSCIRAATLPKGSITESIKPFAEVGSVGSSGGLLKPRQSEIGSFRLCQLPFRKASVAAARAN
jgi:hypothetical protein